MVATVLTACGIETIPWMEKVAVCTLQQYLPLAVLKQYFSSMYSSALLLVATVLTACGIETRNYS